MVLQYGTIFGIANVQLVIWLFFFLWFWKSWLTTLRSNWTPKYSNVFPLKIKVQLTPCLSILLTDFVARTCVFLNEIAGIYEIYVFKNLRTIFCLDFARLPASTLLGTWAVLPLLFYSLDLGFFCFIQGSGVFWLWSNCRFFIEEYSGSIGVVCRASSQCSWVGLGLTKLFKI